MKNIGKISILGLLVLLSLVSCHTSAFNDVDEKLQKEWVLQPIDPSREIIWEFDEGRLTIIHNNATIIYATEEGDTLDFLNYKVTNKIHNQYLEIEYIKPLNAERDIISDMERWLFIFAKNNEFFISSQDHEGRKGEFQFHFFEKP